MTPPDTSTPPSPQYQAGGNIPPENIYNRIRQSSAPPLLPDDKSARETVYLNAVTDDIRQTTELRKKYADIAFKFLIWWVSGVGGLLILDAIDRPPICQESATNYPRLILLCKMIPPFDIERAVMLGIVGGTTVAVVGLAHSVIRGLFSSSADKSAKVQDGS